MKRRDLLKNVSLAGFGLAVFPAESIVNVPETFPFEGEEGGVKPLVGGRTAEEAARDANLMKQKFFTPQELATVTILCNIIIPADAKSGSASQAGVPAFIEFMMKDQPRMQVPMRGGLRWLDSQCIKRFGKKFSICTPAQQIEMVDEIAYPEKAKPAMWQGVYFFNLMRNLTASGFYSSEMGVKDIGYMGNVPNNWDGVPAEVLKQYGLE